MQLEIDRAKRGQRWVSYFDVLGFTNRLRCRGLVDVFFDIRSWLTDAEFFAGQYQQVEFGWFSDTVIFYTADPSRDAFCAISDASYSFFDELILAGVPLRGAMAFGDLYGDKPNGIYLGEALIDAYCYGEKFNWLGFVLHESAVRKASDHNILLPETYEREWDAPLKDRGRRGKERTVAYLIGSKSGLPATGNPYLCAVHEMAASSPCERDKAKYTNTLAFLSGAYGSDPVRAIVANTAG